MSDKRRADITVRHLLNMASGISDGKKPLPTEGSFEWALGKVEGSPAAKLTGEPGTVFNYSNCGVAHLVLVFRKAAGKDLFPFLKERLFDPVGMEKVTWQQIGGKGKIGPYNQGYSGVNTNPREHARFCYLALHKGEWAGKRVIPTGYYDFAWTGTKVNPTYGAQWWVYPRIKDGPKDLVQTAGAAEQPRLRDAKSRPGVRSPRRRHQVSKGVRAGTGEESDRGSEQVSIRLPALSASEG